MNTNWHKFALTGALALVLILVVATGVQQKQPLLFEDFGLSVEKIQPLVFTQSEEAKALKIQEKKLKSHIVELEAKEFSLVVKEKIKKVSKRRVRESREPVSLNPPVIQAEVSNLVAASASVNTEVTNTVAADFSDDAPVVSNDVDITDVKVEDKDERLRKEGVKVIIALKDDEFREDVLEAMQDVEFSKNHEWESTVSGYIDEDALEELEESPYVEEVRVPETYELALGPAATQVGLDQYVTGLHDSVPVGTNFPFGSMADLDGDGIVVFMADSGIKTVSTAGVRLGGASKVVDTYSFVSRGSATTDFINHGTPMANTIGAAEGEGYTGIGNALRFWDGQILEQPGSSIEDDDVIAAIQRAIAEDVDNGGSHDIRVLYLGFTGQNSLDPQVFDPAFMCNSGETNPSQLTYWLKEAAQTMLIVAPTGNNGEDTNYRMPSCNSNVLGVGGTVTNTGEINPNSNRGHGANVVAPTQGVAVSTTGGVGSFDGTSYSAAMVTGTAALLMQIYEQEYGVLLTSERTRELFQETGTWITDSATGEDYRRLNVPALFSTDPHDPVVAITSADQTSVAWGASDNNQVDCELYVDGTAAIPAQQVSLDTAAQQNAQSFDLSFLTPQAAPYAISIVCKDQDVPTKNEGSDSVSVTVPIPNAAPVFSAVPAQSTQEDVANSIDLLSYATDPNGDQLVFEVVTENTAEIDCSFSGSTLTFDPASNWNGAGSCDVRATDGNLYSNTVTISLDVSSQNDPPTVANPIGSATDATEEVAYSFTFADTVFTDVDGNTLAYSQTGAPAWMTFDVGTRTFSGTPQNADVGSVSITVTASDGHESVSDTFTLSVVNTNDAPTVANAIGTVPNAQEDSAYSYTVPANTFNDVDAGDSLTYSATGVPAWLTFNAQTLELSGTPANADVGTATVTITATDVAQEAVSDTFTLTIENTNDAPTVASGIQSLVTDATEDNAYSYTIPSNTFVDVDVGDSLTYSASGLPAWLMFDAQTRELSGTPANADVGTVTVTITATDVAQEAVSDTFSFDVSNVNDRPTLAAAIGSAPNAREDSVYSFTVPVNTFVDVDAGDALTYSVTGLPTWLTFDVPTRTLSGTPTNTHVGTTSITVTATDGSQESVSDTFTLEVENTNDAPIVANAIGTVPNAREGEVYSYVIPADTFSDVDSGDTLTLSVTGLPTWMSLSGDELSGTPQNGDVGTSTITLTATDNSGESVSDSFTVQVVNVNNAPTVANAIGTVPNAREDSVYSYTVPANTFNDVDVGDSLTYTASTVPLWMAFDPLTREFSGTPTNAHVGTTSITITATDGSQESVSDTFTLEVENTNDAPTVANAIGTAPNAVEGTAYSFTVPADTFSDVDARDTLTLSATGMPTWMSLSGDEFIGTPQNGDVGTSRITLTATDNSGESVSNSFTVQVVNVNNPPTVANAIGTVPNAREDSVYSYTVPANTFNDVDAGDSLTYSMSNAPSWMAFDAPTRTLSGTPTNAHVGTASITVTATDGAGESTSDTFTLEVENTNDAPTVANAVSSAPNAPEDSAYSFTVPANTFEDVDAGDVLTYTTSALPVWLTFDAQTREFYGTPDNNDVAVETITVTATDGSQESVSDTFTLEVENTNDAPTVANAIGIVPNAQEDSVYSYTVPANTFDDVDARDSLTYSATSVPVWLTFNAQTRELSGTPANADVGSVTVTITATDSARASVDDTVTLTIENTNDAPTVANAIGTAPSAREGVAYSFVVPANTFDDVDVGDSLTLSATGMPTWLTFDNVQNEFVGTPTNNDVGTSTITLTATDGAGDSVDDQFTVEVVNVNTQPFVTNPISSQSIPNVDEGQAYSFTFAADTFDDNDAGDVLTYTTSSLPAWLSFDDATRTFSGTPGSNDAGVVFITVTARDNGGLTVDDSFSFDVNDVNSAPTIGFVDLTASNPRRRADFTCFANNVADDGPLNQVSLGYAFMVGTTVLQSGPSDTYTDCINNAQCVKGQVVTCEVTADDGLGGVTTATSQQSLTIENTPPVLSAVNPPALTTVEQQNYVAEFTITDDDNDPTTLELNQGPNNLGINGMNVEWTSHDPFLTGPYTIEVYASDGIERSTSISWDLSVTNLVPVIDTVSTLSTVEDQTTDLVHDVNLDSTTEFHETHNWVTYSASSSTLAVDIDPQTGELTIAASEFTNENVGTHQVEITAADALDSDVVTIDVEVSNNPGVLLSNNYPTTGRCTERYTTNVDSSDELDGPTRYTLINAPTGAVIDPLDGTFTWTPDPTQHGPQSITFEVDDGNGGVDQDTITVDVLGVADLVISDLFVAGDFIFFKITNRGYVDTAGDIEFRIQGQGVDIIGTQSNSLAANGGEMTVSRSNIGLNGQGPVTVTLNPNHDPGEFFGPENSRYGVILMSPANLLSVETFKYFFVFTPVKLLQRRSL